MAAIPIPGDCCLLDDLVYAVVRQTHESLISLSQELGKKKTDSDKREAIKTYVKNSRTLLARLLVIVRWAREQRDLSYAYASDVHRLDLQRNELRRAADELYYMHHSAPEIGKTGLWQASVPPYDVRAALDIIQRGTYAQLPRCIDLSAERAVPAAREEAAALEWTQGALRLRRCTWMIPEGVEVRDGRGCVLATVPGEYEIALSAHPPSSGRWKVLKLRLLLRLKGEGGSGGAGSGRAWGKLWERVQQMLLALPEADAQPLLAIHAELHAKCSQLLLEHLHTQANALARGAWLGNLRVERVEKVAEAAGIPEGGGGASGPLKGPPPPPSLQATVTVPAASGGQPSAPSTAGLRMSYLWTLAAGAGGEGGGASSQRVSLLLVPGRSYGIEMRHEPPLLAAGAEGGGSACRLPADARDAEGLLMEAIKARSLGALRLANGSVAASSPSAPPLPPRAEAPLEATGSVPRLTFSSGASLAIQPRDGAYALLGPHARAPPLEARETSRDAALLGALCVSEAAAAIEQGALALGAPTTPLPAALLRHAAEPSGLSAAAPATPDTAPPGTAPPDQLLWVPLPALPAGWGLQLALSSTPPAVRPTLMLLGKPLGRARLRTAPQPATTRAVSGASAEDASATASVLAAYPLPEPPDAPGKASEAAAATAAASLAVLASGRLPAMLSLAVARATAETLHAGVQGAGLTCERLGDGLSLQLGRLCELPESGACTPLLEAAVLQPSDTPTAPPILRPTEEGWAALIPLLAPPPGVAPSSRLPSGGLVHFDARGATMCYAPPTAWAVHDLLCDLQGIATAHALLRRLGGTARTVGVTPAAVLCEASCAGFAVRTRAGRQVRLDWSTTTHGRILGAVAAAVPARPALLPRLRLDGAPLAAVQRQAGTLVAAGALDDVFRLCDDLELPAASGAPTPVEPGQHEEADKTGGKRKR